MRIRTYSKVLITGILLIFIGGYAIYTSDWFKHNYTYPFTYQPLIYHYALENNINPFLIAGVIKAESSFNPNARSHKGALGLMQIMPETGQWVAERLNCQIYTDNNSTENSILKDPETNIRFGTWYLSFLQREFSDNEVLYLAAYNGGIGNVKHWMSKYGWSEDFTDIDQIPFAETKNYVKRVLYYKQKYQEIYGQ